MNQFLSYKIVIEKRARKVLTDLPKSESKKIVLKLQSLVSTESDQFDIKKLQGYEDLYRLRVGSYRVIFVVITAQKELFVVAIGHRREIYDIAKRMKF
jgi:mRNA interferase RelE/StbE